MLDKKINLKAFTLIELTIALALLALIITISIPNFWFLSQQIVASDLEKLHMTFSYLQQSAISSNRNYILTFNKSDNSYSYENRREKLSQGVQFATITRVKGSPSTNADIVKPITFVNEKIIFYPNGQIQPGSVYLSDTRQKYLYAITVPISQISFIRKYKYQRNKWTLI